MSKLHGNYRHVYICDALSSWLNISNEYDSDLDLVLTFDFALVKYLDSKNAMYIDHLIDNKVMESENHNIYRFFESWHYDENGNDLFNYKGVDFGISFRLEYWNDYTYIIRLILNMDALSSIESKKIIVCSNDKYVFSALDILSLKYEVVKLRNDQENGGYYFPIAQWLDSKIRPNGFTYFKYKLRSIVGNLHSRVAHIFDKTINKNKKYICIQQYHPTKPIINGMLKNKNIQVVKTNFNNVKDIINISDYRIIPEPIFNGAFGLEISEILLNYNRGIHSRLILNNGLDITSVVTSIINSRVESCIEDYVSSLNNYIRYVRNNQLDLHVIISNLGKNVTLLDCVCRAEGKPTFLIINGMLGPDYSDESKLASHINCYSNSIKVNYFNNDDHVVCLGDPRMDAYYGLTNEINYEQPVLVIGTSGFNSVDLNSYVAVEFDFMFDVLSAAERFGQFDKIIIKCRPNGYKKQYEKFVSEYFPNVDVKIVDNISMMDALRLSDFYVSIYSQTLIEASSLGVPSLYYRKDNEFGAPPFDNKSELVTVDNIPDLLQAMIDFKSRDSRYDTFLDKNILEKYVGPLDGKSLERNVNYINMLIGANDAQ
ncbi:hypothetical protein [Vibrio tapetis]|uniref:Uncharacterized protein n=1 Tax=Vibrio tapetis subsp. tapetis TaxID=1671868 RepID=A0A2N8ZGH7_9VIBR|nr:hypothetical protein [Vibrio tapetis]SON50965.1 conserved protein of unknown function [Vibrio tapetis subsp. tapetis]